LRFCGQKKLGKTALHMGVSGGAAKEINVFAKVTSPRSTLIADATVAGWIDGYPIAGFQ
jgi:hypothetical protein